MKPRLLCAYTGHAKKVNPWEKFDISGIVVNFFAKFILLTEEDTGHICANFVIIYGCIQKL